MKRISWTLGILLTLALLIAAGCSGEDPIKAKRIAIENGTYKPKPKPEPEPEPNPNPNPDPNPDPDPNPNPDPDPTPDPNPDDKLELKEVTFTFDEWVKPKGTYQLPVEKSLSKLLAGDPYWMSASNVGAVKALLTNYPVRPLSKGRTGQALELTTIKARPMFGTGIIAGALYCGSLDEGIMTSKPLESTKFGQPVFAIPISIKGYYQWLPGKELVDGKKRNSVIKGEQDEATIACVFYDISQDNSYLNGKTLYDDPRILAKVQIHPQPTKEGAWTPFESKLEIVNEAAYKQIDLQKGKYRMALIFSSSARGDEFIGAIGSSLRIDDFTVTLGIPTKK